MSKTRPTEQARFVESVVDTLLYTLPESCDGLGLDQATIAHRDRVRGKCKEAIYRLQQVLIYLDPPKEPELFLDLSTPARIREAVAKAQELRGKRYIQK